MNKQQISNILSELHLPYYAYNFPSNMSLLQSAVQIFSLAFSVSSLPYLQPRSHQEIEPPSFETRIQPSIILQSSSLLSQKSQYSKKGLKRPQNSNSHTKKPSQKESRNVASNLLRIFMKNIIQLRIYDEIIIRIIESRGYQASCQSFHQWLRSYSIDFKNYIRFTEIRRLYNGGEKEEMHAIFRTLLRHYTKGLGMSHTLTSKRIERVSTPMHLIGLRSLPIQLNIK